MQSDTWLLHTCYKRTLPSRIFVTADSSLIKSGMPSLDCCVCHYSPKGERKGRAGFHSACRLPKAVQGNSTTFTLFFEVASWKP